MGAIILQRRESDRGSVNIEEDGLAFVNAGGEARNLDHIQCYNCDEFGHFANNCPNRHEGEQQQGTNLCTSGTHDIPASWVLLDNQSTIDLFCNADMLTNIRRCNTHMNVQCNAGQRSTNMIGDLGGCGTVWYDPMSIANILSLSRVIEKFRVTFDSEQGGSFLLNRSDRGLYFSDFATTVRRDVKIPRDASSAIVMVNTVAANKGNYTNADYLKAVSECQGASNQNWAPQHEPVHQDCHVQPAPQLPCHQG
jgi:hypothetical protein